MSEQSQTPIKIMLGLPCYGNTVVSMFAQSLINLTHAFRDHGVPVQLQWLGTESLVTRARNRIANNFFHSDCTHLLFLDVDLEFDAKDIIRMLGYALKYNMELIGLPYSKKAINWQSVHDATLHGVPAKELQNVSAAVAVNFTSANQEFDGNQPVEVNHLATGLMLISKCVFEKLAAAHPERKYQLMPDEIADGQTRTTAQEFFWTGIDKHTGTYLSEDYAFCQDWRDLGGKIWLCPWAKTTHMGTYFYKCDLQTIAQNNLPLRKS